MHYGEVALIFTENRMCDITYKQSVYIKTTSNCRRMYNCVKMTITYSGMHCNCLVNPPRHLIEKTFHTDKIWVNSNAETGGDTYFQ